MIYHAAGGIDGLSYTNSVEAMEKTLSEGKMAVEVDFNYTTDNRLVCVHNWSDAFYTLESAPSLKEFKALKIQGKYTPMTAEDVIEYMKDYPDLHIIIDTKHDSLNDVISTLSSITKNDADIMNRFIVQLYQPGEKEVIDQNYDFPDKNYLFTCYKYSTDYNVIFDLCTKENINVVTVSKGKFSAEALELFRANNIYVYEHTINRPEQAQIRLDAGVYGIYTDFISEDSLNFRR